jgi:hypothetical protein
VDAWGPNFWEIPETYAQIHAPASTKLWSKAMTSCCSTSDEAARMKQSRQREKVLIATREGNSCLEDGLSQAMHDMDVMAS